MTDSIKPAASDNGGDRPGGKSLRRRLRWLWLTLGLVVAGLVVFTVFVTGWEYTNSVEFCGTTCHTMPPEYAAYQVSPHARVACVDCHLGEKSILMAIPRKVLEIRHLTDALTMRWESPVYVKNLRPARLTCEECHYPEKFSSDIVTEIRHYGNDAQNSLTTTWLVMKVGGGTQRAGLGKGIHWHIENQVYFIATDALRQTIPYIKTVDANGKVSEYTDVTAQLPADFAQTNAASLRLMDCTDCHNRVAHEFPAPEKILDEALARNQIDQGIPSIRAKGVEVLSASYESQEQAGQAIDGLLTFYKTTYPDYYVGHLLQIQQAVDVLKNGYRVSVFPDMDVASTTHPDNTGHDQFPGCFRCHDGKHVTAEKQTIRLECNICHSLPALQKAGEPIPSLPVAQPTEPATHLDTNWISAHRFQFDQTCATCHDLSNPGGTDGSSFCSNSACHGRQWKYVGLDAPQVRAMVQPPNTPGTGQPEPVPHPIAPRTDCAICHGAGKVHPMPGNHGTFTQATCTSCHVPTTSERPESATATPAAAAATPTRAATSTVSVGASPTAAPATTTTAGSSSSGATSTQAPSTTQPTATTGSAGAGAAPAIPHDLTGRDQCLTCHATTSTIRPAPANHAGRDESTCQMCHKQSK